MSFLSPLKMKKITLPYEFIFVFTWYLIEAILLEEACKSERFGKNIKSGMTTEGSWLLKKGSDLLHNMILKGRRGRPWSPEL